MASPYNGKCPSCGYKAYLGFAVIECSNIQCKYYVKPPKDDDETKIIKRADIERTDFETGMQNIDCGLSYEENDFG